MLGKFRENCILTTEKQGEVCGVGVTFKEYQNDFVVILKEMESKRLPFLHRSQQLHYRKYLIHIMKKACKASGFAISSLHLAAYFLDLFMENHHINLRRLMLVAIASVMIAGKIEETSYRVPKLKYFLPKDNDELKKYFNEMEASMLVFFNWNLMIPTAAHFVLFYMPMLLTDEERKRPGPSNIINRMSAELVNYMDCLLNDVHLMQGYSPSKVGAALIAACRIRYGYPAWNTDLSTISNQKPTQFQDILDRILYGSNISENFTCINCYDKISYDANVHNAP